MNRVVAWPVVLVFALACEPVSNEEDGTPPLDEPRPVELSFSCSAMNVAAFVREDLRVKCTATAKDGSGQVVPTAEIRFLAEAGGFVQGDPSEGVGVYFYNPRIGGNQPKDVPPLGDAGTGEPRWQDGPVIRNPRDGLVTLVAWVEGDSLGLGEPYVDENDNGQYDPGEPFVDHNDNGVWDDAQDSVIWKELRILWSGSLLAPETQTLSLPRGGSSPVSLPLVDERFNLLASHGGEVSFSGTGACLADLNIQLPIPSGAGMDLDASNRLRQPSRRESYLKDSTLTLLLENPRPNEDLGPPLDLRIVARVSRPLGPDGAEVIDEVVVAEGHCL